MASLVDAGTTTITRSAAASPCSKSLCSSSSRTVRCSKNGAHFSFNHNFSIQSIGRAAIDDAHCGIAVSLVVIVFGVVGSDLNLLEQRITVGNEMDFLDRGS